MELGWKRHLLLQLLGRDRQSRTSSFCTSPFIQSALSNNIDPVVTHAIRLHSNPTHPFLHLLCLLLPSFALPSFMRIQRLPPPPLRPPHPLLSFQPPRPHRAYSYPSKHQRLGGGANEVPALGSAHPRLEQVPLVHCSNRGRRPADSYLRRTCSAAGAPGRTGGARLCRKEAKLEPASKRYAAEREL